MNRRIRLPLVAALAWSLAWGGLAPPARASAAPPATPTSASGVYSAIACGMGVKMLLMGGALFTPVIIITAVACAHMIVDALVTPD